MGRETFSVDAEELMRQGSEKLRHGSLDVSRADSHESLMQQASLLAQQRDRLLVKYAQALDDTERGQIHTDYLGLLQSAEAINAIDNTVPIDLDRWQKGLERLERLAPTA